MFLYYAFSHEYIIVFKRDKKCIGIRELVLTNSLFLYKKNRLEINLIYLENPKRHGPIKDRYYLTPPFQTANPVL